MRFRDPALVRGLIVGALRHALAAAGHRASTTVAADALAGFRARRCAPAVAHARLLRLAHPAAGRAGLGGGGWPRRRAQACPA